MKKLLAILLALLIVGAGALAEGTLTVRGLGVVTVDADRATVCLGVREVAPDVKTAQNTVNEEIAAVIEALKAFGVEADNLSTGGIGIYPNWDYSGEVESINGYTAYNTVLVTLTDVNAVGALVDAAFEAGANSLDYVEFTAVDTAEAADRALELAVQSAQAKAQTMASAAGVELGEIVELRDNEDLGYVPNDAFAKSAQADSGAGTQVLASKQQVSASVTITFAIAGE